MCYNVCVEIKVYGKINIALNITGTESGMHLIDTVMASVSLFDRLSVEPADKISVSCDMPLSGKNIAMTAAEKVEAICGERLAVTIQKGIPLGGGMGGSSADAAGVFAAADKLFGLSGKCDIIKLAASVGADVPYMLCGGFVRARGFGEILTPVGGLPGARLLIAECGSVDTGACYKLSDEMELPVSDIGEVVSNLGRGMIFRGANALMPAARILNPRIKAAEDIFAALGSTAQLTGSGGCVFGAYDEKIKAGLMRAGFKCHDVKVVGGGVEF